MTAETLQNTTKTFKFSYPTCTNEDLLFKLEVPVEIPHGGSTRELVQRVLKMFHIPVYLEDELNEKLAEFVAEETKKFHNERDAKLLDQLKNSELNIEGIVKNWEKLFKENVIDFAEQKGSSDEEVFAAAYHKLVHSPALDTILQVEANYAKTVMNMLKNRDEDIKKLTQTQTEEMEEKMRLLNTLTTEEEINELAVQHFEQQSLAAGRWDSQLDALRHTQRAAHRAWLMTAINEYQTDEKITPSNSPLMSFPTELAPLPMTPRLEESFTIHLGSQLKQTHNIRLAALDMMHLCSVQRPDADGGGWAGAQPALALYSGELSGAVLLVDSMPTRSPLLSSARAAAEHHFPDVDAQLRHIAEAIKEPVEKRNAERQSSKDGSEKEQRPRYRGAVRLQAGDVFVTRHSNLAEAHVVFHLVADDESLKSGDMTSRHPAILGLRNILKAACCNDVTSIAFPLLLKNELTEEMTAAWCMRRAELVLKCVKGFVLEASGGGGADLRTLCATVPPDIRPALFSSLAALLPTIFRVSGPVRAKTTTQ
ncbi:protein C12orf4 homolog [Maniola jurtina]|uniref:protein C12orf4 homolog n=1 Tax=Maniola jurtina TaxID=191418 RepID=UPI001E68CB5A|nr:protein C12orf4 homolog [Maniola jurtina]XP_045780599.1 protein C12orf4 homolog [Maniola jurtina]